MPEGDEPQAASPNEPAPPASGNEPSGLPEPTAAPPPTFDRAAALAALPGSLQEGLSQAPDHVIAKAIEEIQAGFIPKPDWTRMRQKEKGELTSLQERLQREEAQREQMERLLEQRYAQDPAPPAPDVSELGVKLLESTDPKEYMASLEQAIGPMVEARAQAIIDSDPLIRRVRAAAAADAARPADMDPQVYNKGVVALNARLRSKGIEPSSVDSDVFAFLVQPFAELEQARSVAPPATPAPAAHPGAPAVTPPVSTGPTAATTYPDADPAQTFGPGSSLKDRVAATLAGLDMTPGDLTRLRSTQKSV